MQAGVKVADKSVVVVAHIVVEGQHILGFSDISMFFWNVERPQPKAAPGSIFLIELTM